MPTAVVVAAAAAAGRLLLLLLLLRLEAAQLHSKGRLGLEQAPPTVPVGVRLVEGLEVVEAVLVLLL